MKAEDVGPLAVFRFKGRVFLKSGGMVQMLCRDGRGIESYGSWVGRIAPYEEVEVIDLTAPLPGSECTECFGSGFSSGKWDQPLHGGSSKARCSKGCGVEGQPDDVVETTITPAVCECCSQLLPACRQSTPTEMVSMSDDEAA